MGSTPGLVALALLAAVLPASAQRLPTTVRPIHYDLQFLVDISHARFEGTERIHVQIAEPTTRVVINAAELRVRDASIGSGAAAQEATVTLDERTEQATLTVPRRLARGEEDVYIHYSGVLNDQLRGFYLSKGKDRSYAVTQFEATDARRAFPCFDEPSFKATFALKLIVDRGDRAISNGRILSDVAGPVPTQHTVTFATTPKMSTYLVAMAVGDFQCSEGIADAVPIRICATPDKKDLTRIALDAAQQILRFYDTWYAMRYPFGKLDVVAVPDFAAGAMENTAAIFYRETDLLADTKSASVATRKNIASVLAHEMAHQWFGDLVTMAWWDDIWLNEGFATWMANKPLAAAHADWNIAVDEAAETQRALDLDSLKATRPIHNDVEQPAEIDEAFDTIAYEKGASVVRMVESYVGAETFRKGVNAYLQGHAYGNATSEDFAKAIASTSGTAVDRILPTFVNQTGVPVIGVSVSCPRNETVATLTQHRFLLDGTDEGDRTLWQVPVCFEKASSPSCFVLNDQRHEYTIDASACRPWVFANAGARGYYRTEYTPELLRALGPHVQAQLTAPERLSLIDDEWAMVRASRHSAADYLTLVTQYGGEHVSGVLADVTNRLTFVREYLTSGESRPQFETFARRLLRPLFDEVGFAPAPSDTDDRRALRATVVDALGTTANDSDVIGRARSALDRALAGGPPIDPTLEQAVVEVSARHGDVRLFDALSAAAERSASPEEQYRYLYALTQFGDPALVDRALARVLTPQIRSQDAAVYLGRFFENPEARDRAWAFVTTHWRELEPKVTVFGGDVRIVSAAGEFCDVRSRDNVAAFFRAHPLPAAARALEQAIERIDNCIALRTKQMPVVSEWLAGK
jgi:aminopeptidase N